MKLSAPGLEPGTYGLKVPKRGFDRLRSNLIRGVKTLGFWNKSGFRPASEKWYKRPSEVWFWYQFCTSFSGAVFSIGGRSEGREVERVPAGVKTAERGTPIPEFLCEVNLIFVENYYR